MAVTGERQDEALAGPPRHGGVKGWLDGVRATRTGRLTLKIVIGVVGAALVIGGLLLVPLPGPGWLIVFAGLALLATEFAWAHRVLEFGKKTLSSWTGWLLRQNWAVRILVSAVTLAFAAVLVWFMLKLSLGIDLVEFGRNFLTRP
ncbi:TIGR02611 family protein [Sphaerisporangium sp. TRM90804]|uniref:TIGR02611 family protein n=1 Tax=Sphaerisporangium sp. TRM90804 TaxID=3031113 RepID=UPI00244AD210|nr:TIGR02611 family protein [Sphaerisporangium sp. TRM90804]MDH2424691.1 TIGR02611 family protein [Sphaerisporangium sp. TRM90804]